MNERILRRSESYVGIHFDVHQRPGQEQAGAEMEEKLDRMLEELQPDYIQCGAKGHPGITCFHTEYGPEPIFRGEDSVAVWRRVTKRHKVALYAHYSTLWENDYAAGHGGSIRLSDEDPRRDLEGKLVSLYSPYLEERVIPQLKELAAMGLDGVWVDGDCWAAYQDYREEAFAEFTAETGITEIPQKKGDPHFAEWIDFFRTKYKAFLRGYVDAVHAGYPDFQICSNWMYSMYAPEPVDIGVDFLSGDYPCFKSVVEARSHARCLALQNKPWDLMAWGFNDTAKPAAMLCQEAAVTLALGGGIEFYYTQNRDYSLKSAFIKPFGEAIRFCRARQKYCQNSRSAAEIAIYLSKQALFSAMIQPYTPKRADVENLDGALKCILEGGFAADIAAGHQLAENRERYRLIVIPEWGSCSDADRELFRDYTMKGGNLLLVGPSAVEAFADLTGIRPGEAGKGNVYIPLGDAVACSSCAWRPLLGGDPKTEASDKEEQGGRFVLAAESRLGAGRILAVGANLFSAYNKVRSCYVRDYIASLVLSLLGEPSARIIGTHLADLTLQVKDGRLYPNLVNVSGYAHTTDMVVYDEITPLYRICVKLKQKKRPARVLLQPDGRELEFNWDSGWLTVKIDRLDIHAILEIEEEER